jgi:small subunit ribosomal protein S6
MTNSVQCGLNQLHSADIARPQSGLACSTLKSSHLPNRLCLPEYAATGKHSLQHGHRILIMPRLCTTCVEKIPCSGRAKSYRGVRKYTERSAVLYYETIFIVNPDISQENTEKLTDDLVAKIEKVGGRIVKRENWGSRPLSYSIAKRKRGNYVLLVTDGEPQALQALEHAISLEERVIRTLTTRLTELSDKPSPLMRRATPAKVEEKASEPVEAKAEEAAAEPVEAKAEEAAAEPTEAKADKAKEADGAAAST